MYTPRQSEQSYRLAPVEEWVARLARANLWRRTSLSSFVASGMILFLVGYALALGMDVRQEVLTVESRLLGNPETAIQRIQNEHFITLSELEELTSDPSLDRFDRIAYEHAPLILDEAHLLRQERRDDVPIGVYYNYSVSTYGRTELIHIEYWMYFSDENIGMSSQNRMARWGHPMDRELIFRMSLLNGSIFGAEYQAPVHRLTPFAYPESGRPVFRIASGNHNFQLVQPHELEALQVPTELLAPLPKYEMNSPPLSDPDIMALAAQEALIQHGVDMSHYVYVGIRDPAYVLTEPYPAVVDVGVLSKGRRTYVSENVPGGVRVWGYRLVAIDLGFTPMPGDIEDVTLIVSSRAPGGRPSLEIAQVFIYPELRIPT